MLERLGPRELPGDAADYVPPSVAARTVEVSDPTRVAYLSQTTLSVDETTEVIEALSGLGYSGSEIQAALSGLPKDEELSTEEMVLFALKRLGR